MGLETIFTILLGVGVGYAVIGFILGEFIGHGNTDVTSVSPLKPAVVASFIIVFGGAGLIFLQMIPPITAVPLAGLVGTAVAYIVYRGVVIPLARAQNTTAIERKSLIGHSAQVTEKIPEGGFGKITYRVNDSIHTAPAKAWDGAEIVRNTSVEIVDIENNAYYVRP